MIAYSLSQIWSKTENNWVDIVASIILIFIALVGGRKCVTLYKQTSLQVFIAKPKKKDSE